MHRTPHGLIADIGGTNARFALVDEAGYYNEIVFACADFEHVQEAVRAYMGQTGLSDLPPHGAFAIAGPVNADVFFATNMKWSFSISDLGTSLGFKTFRLFNDFEAVALAIPHLTQDHIIPITHPESDSAPPSIHTATSRPHAPIGILGPGTGLGVASLVHDGVRYHAVAGEGGHVSLPIDTAREFAVLDVLLHKYSHVSAERVCSGKGLVNLYNALKIIDKRIDLPERDAESIALAAQSNTCPVCVESLDLMLGFLGRIAGNLALTLGAHGGIYIAGGIPLKLGNSFFTSRFRREFEKKGRFVSYLQSIPTYLVTHPFPAFLGLQHTILPSK